MRPGTVETLLSAVGVLVLLGVLVAFDPRVHDQVGTVLTRNGAQTTVTSVSSMAGEITTVVLASAREQSMSHAPLLVFGVVAAVLVTFMLRT